MSRIALCWELGAGFGHLVPLRLLAREFRRLGHEVVLIAPDSPLARDGEAGGLWRFHPAPVLERERKAFPLSLCYADNLRRNGYGNAAGLPGYLAAWKHLLAELRPGLVLVDHAPAALLSAPRDVPKAAIGTGFALPPPTVPMPSLQPWLPLPQHTLLAHEMELLCVLNPALRANDLAELDAVAGIFAGVDCFLTVFPELDVYARDADDACWMGPLVDEARSAVGECEVPAAGSVFVFMSAANRCVGPVLDWLERSGQAAWVYLRGGEGRGVAPRQIANIRFLDRPVELDAVALRCRFAITQGGSGTLWAFLRHGVPTFICPMELEQALLAYRLKARGLGGGISLFSSADSMIEKLEVMSRSSDATEAVRDYAIAHADYSSRSSAQRIVRSCLARIQSCEASLN